MHQFITISKPIKCQSAFVQETTKTNEQYSAFPLNGHYIDASILQ